jgi:biopolymer transport protein ExbD
MASMQQARPFSVGFRMMPMIDVLFLLLIFFILTAHFRPQEKYLPLRFPAGSSPTLGTVEPLRLTISTTKAGCAVRVGDFAATALLADKMDESLASIVGRIQIVFKSQKRTTKDPMELVCDDKVEWQYVARLYNTLYGMGVSDITFRMAQ